MSHQSKRQPTTDLVLTGGGARAAYQAGVLRAVVDILDAQAQSNFASPFDIICGTSAGAINAAAYACRADRPRLAVHRMCRLWATLTTSMIYRADAPDLIKIGVRWLSLLALGWMSWGLRNKRQSLLDNQPMADLRRLASACAGFWQTEGKSGAWACIVLGHYRLGLHQRRTSDLLSIA